MSDTPATGLSERLKQIKPSMTTQVAQRARDLTAQGHKVINMGSGELDFDTPEHIQLAGIDAIVHGKTRYTNVGGMPELKAAIIEKFKTENGLTYTASQIVIGTGGKPLVYNAFVATLNPGDEVIIPAPYWVSYPDMVKLAGGTPVSISTTADAGFKITPEQLEATITPNTRWVILNSPNNPTGAVYSLEELIALGDVLKRHPELLVLSDNIYEYLTYDGDYTALATAVPELNDRILTLSGMSKGFAMTGWRIGFCGGPEWLIKGMTLLQGQSSGNACSISQAASVVALEADKTFVAGWKDELMKRRDHAVEILQRSDRMRIDCPPGAFYLFVECHKAIGLKTSTGNTIENDLDLANYLLEEAGVAVVPGTAFGAPGHLRLAFCIDASEVMQACENMVTAIGTLK